MISFKCKNCGGELSVDVHGNLSCAYCESRFNFSDAELRGYREFRMEMLNYLKGEAMQSTPEQNERIWDMADEVVLNTADGTDIHIRHIYTYSDKVVTMYLAREMVLYIFNNRTDAEAMERGLRMIEIPPADVRHLDECFPKLQGRYDLQGGKVMLAFARPDNFFPLSMFGSLEPKHVAWMISRMENVCCVLEYSDLRHYGLSEETFFVNPFTHQGMLVGGWWSTRRATPMDAARTNEDLVALRKTAMKVLGNHLSSGPKELEKFLKGSPAKNAFIDFELWDRVIEEGFGGHHFAKMDASSIQ